MEFIENPHGYQNYRLYKSGKFCRLKNGEEIVCKALQSADGYYRICMANFEYMRVFHLHKLVAKYFVPNPNNYQHVLHKDRDYSNNSAENLEWVSEEEYNTLPATYHDEYVYKVDNYDDYFYTESGVIISMKFDKINELKPFGVTKHNKYGNIAVLKNGDRKVYSVKKLINEIPEKKPVSIKNFRANVEQHDVIPLTNGVHGASKPVVYFPTEQVFQSISEASLETRVSTSTVSQHCRRIGGEPVYRFLHDLPDKMRKKYEKKLE